MQSLDARHRKKFSFIGVVMIVMSVLVSCNANSSESASSDTIKVGIINTTVRLPEYRYGSAAAIDYINSHGGVRGAKIEPTYCDVDGTPEASINCANKVMDAGVAMTFFGVDVGNDASVKLLADAGLPVVSVQSSSEEQLTNPNSFLFHGGNGPQFGGLMMALKSEGAKNITTVDFSGIGAGARSAYLVGKELAPDLGVGITEFPIPVSTSNFAAAVASARSAESDGFLLVLSESACTGFLQALAESEFTGPSGGPCSQYLAALGNDAPPTVTSQPVWTPDLRRFAPEAVQRNLDVFSKAMKSSAHGDLANTPGASATFSTWMELAEVLKDMDGSFDASSIKATLQNASNVPGFLGPNPQCGEEVWPSEPAVCSDEQILLRVVPGSDGHPEREPIKDGLVDLSSIAY